MSKHAEAGKQQCGMAPHQFLDPDPRSLFAGQAYKARQRRGNEDHFAHRCTIGQALHLEQDAGALIGNERKRVCRIDCLRGQDRDDVFFEVVPQPVSLCPRERVVVDQADPGCREVLRKPGQHVLLGIDKVLHRIEQPAKLLLRGFSVDRKLVDLAAHLSGNTGHAHHHEFVEIVAADRKEAQAFKEGIIAIDRFCEHATVERKPAEFAIEEPLLHWRQGALFCALSICRHVSVHCALRVTLV